MTRIIKKQINKKLYHKQKYLVNFNFNLTKLGKYYIKC